VTSLSNFVVVDSGTKQEIITQRQGRVEMKLSQTYMLRGMRKTNT